MSETVFNPKRLINLLIVLSIVIFIVIYLTPIYWLVMTSFKPSDEMFSWPPKLVPSTLVAKHYADVFQNRSLFWYVKNSLIISISSVFLAMVIGCLAAYSFAKFSWLEKIRKNILLWIISLRIMPPIAISVPIYLIFVRFHLVDVYHGVILAYIFLNLPFITWLMYVFFRGVPSEIEEAAMIDGCSKIKLLLKITLPLTKPALVTVLLLTFITAWNEFLFAVKLTMFNTRTIPVLMSGFVIDRGLLWGQICAVATISLIPVIIIAFFVQRYIVTGLTFGAMR